MLNPENSSNLYRCRFKPQNWKSFLYWAAALFLCVILTPQAFSQRHAGTKPNILFILADDQRWDTIHALGNRDIQTPNLDRLVQRGFRFKNAYCMGSMIGAVCTPSRTMLITGRSLWRIPENPAAKTAPPGVPLLPNLLNDAGYVTFHCGKAGNTCTFGLAAFNVNIATQGRTALSATEHTDKTIEFLKNHDGKKPFFIYLAPPVPHDPRLAPAEFVNLYDPTKLTLSKNFMPQHPFDNGWLHGRDEELAPHPRPPGVMRQHLADYYATISHLDHEVGRILDVLKERGFADDTIIIFSSDQGLAVGGRHGLMGKQNLYEHVKPPLIFAGPGIRHGQSDALVYLYDLFPTICDFGGAKIPEVIEGKNLLPIIKGKQRRVRDWLFGAYMDCQRMIRDERWKLIKYNAGGVKNAQLFDLKNDADELNNVAADPKHAKQLAGLDRLLADARKEFGDPVDFEATRVVASAAAEPLQSSSQTRPNIVLVMTDDQGYGDLGFTGNPIIKTPHIDAFAKGSVRFTDFHVSPTCAPTRCALMTGRHEFRSGVTHTIFERERMSLKATTIAQVLKSAGYTAGIFGKWHLGDEAAYQPGRRGFDEVFIHGAGGIGQTYAGSCGDAPGNTYFNPAILHNGRFEKTKGYCTDVFFDQALNWMDTKRNGKSPFFAYITPNAPHAPLQCPEEYAKRHANQVDTNVAKFFGMIENIDDNFGRLLAKLDEWGIARDTLVIFMTDNGGTAGVKIFNAGMRGQKVTPYEGGTRVPSFWRWPAGFQGGRDCNALTAHIDIFPTLAQIAGAKVPEHVNLDGRSLVPLLKDPKADWPDRFLFTHVGRWEKGKAEESKSANCAVRNARFQLVNGKELYDLKADPGETNNIIAGHAEVVAKMRAAYDQWWSEILPALENENVTGPKVNPFKELYWRQFGGGPEAAESK